VRFMTPGNMMEPCTFMGLPLSNRFIRSATLEGLATAEGTPSPELKKCYTDLAAGGVGLISTSACLPDPSWTSSPVRFLSLHTDQTLARWEETVQAVHQAGAFMSVQLAPFFVLQGQVVAPYAYKEGVRALTVDEIRSLAAAYGRAAARARKIGADAVQVHGGHGFPLSQFLSPFYNHRQDDYGGPLPNRARIFLEIREAITETCGNSFPVWVKMNAFEGLSNGLTLEEAVSIAALLSQKGYQAIEVTGGSLDGSYDSRGPLKRKEWFEGYYLKAASRVKAGVDVPVVAVGGIRNLTMIETILSTEKADLIAMSRPFICEPGLIRRWKSGDRSPSQCLSCNGCVTNLYRGKGLHCLPEQKRS
jgi:2,4-dienoyl-CoA reductase-like NADH-dependent reductase (Old Yellow Enzyme family)